MKHFFAVIFVLLLVAVPVAAQDDPSYSTPSLSESFVSDDERLTLNYPSNWIVQSETPEMVTVVSSRSLLTQANADLASGDVAMFMLFGVDMNLLNPNQSFTNDEPVMLLATLLKNLGNGADSIMEFGRPQAVMTGDYAAARADGDLQGNDAFIMLVDYGDGAYALVIATTAQGEMNKYSPKLIAIAASVSYSP